MTSHPRTLLLTPLYSSNPPYTQRLQRSGSAELLSELATRAKEITEGIRELSEELEKRLHIEVLV